MDRAIEKRTHLREGEEESEVAVDAFGLELLTRHDTFPCRSDLDVDPVSPDPSLFVQRYQAVRFV